MTKAFACVVGAWLRETGADPALTNPTGAPSPSGIPPVGRERG